MARHRLLGSLVVAQFALALMLSVGAGLLVRSFVRLLNTDPGFRPEHVVTASVTLPSGRYATGRAGESVLSAGGRRGTGDPGRHRRGGEHRSAAARAGAPHVFRRRLRAADAVTRPRHRRHVDGRQLLRGARHPAEARAVVHRRATDGPAVASSSSARCWRGKSGPIRTRSAGRSNGASTEAEPRG